jgi:hypothetical protein
MTNQDLNYLEHSSMLRDFSLKSSYRCKIGCCNVFIDSSQNKRPENLCFKRNKRISHKYKILKNEREDLQSKVFMASQTF